MTLDQHNPYSMYNPRQLEDQAPGHDCCNDSARKKQSKVRDCTYKVIPLCATLLITFSSGGILLSTLAYNSPLPRNGVIAVSVILGFLAVLWAMGRLKIYRDHHYTHASRLERARALCRWARCNDDESITNLVLESRPNYAQVPAHGRVNPATPTPPPRFPARQGPDARTQPHRSAQPGRAALPMHLEMSGPYPARAPADVRGEPAADLPPATPARPRPAAVRERQQQHPPQSPPPGAGYYAPYRRPGPPRGARPPPWQQQQQQRGGSATRAAPPAETSAARSSLRADLVLHPSVPGSQAFRAPEQDARLYDEREQGGERRRGGEG